MKIDIVDVQIADISLKADVVFLVDNVDFRLDIQKLREKWGITEFEDYDKFGNFIEYHLDKFQKRSTNALPSPFTEEHLLEDIKKLRRKYNRTIHFDPVILWALFSNKVPENVYRRCYYDRVLIEGEDPNDSKSYQYALIMAPNATSMDVSTSYEEMKKFVWGENHTELTSKKDLSQANLVFGVTDEWDEMIKNYSDAPLHLGSDPQEYKDPKKLDLARELYFLYNKAVLEGKPKEDMTYEELIVRWQELCPHYKDSFAAPDNHSCQYCKISLDESQVGKILRLFKQRM